MSEIPAGTLAKRKAEATFSSEDEERRRLAAVRSAAKAGA
jgi:hypothetical protein